MKYVTGEILSTSFVISSLTHSISKARTRHWENASHFAFFKSSNMLENHSKCPIWIFEFWHFLLIFVQFKLTCLVSLFDRKFFSDFQKLAKMDHFLAIGIFDDFFVHIKRKRSSQWYFFCDFQRLCFYSRRNSLW